MEFIAHLSNSFPAIQECDANISPPTSLRKLDEHSVTLLPRIHWRVAARHV